MKKLVKWIKDGLSREAIAEFYCVHLGWHFMDDETLRCSHCKRSYRELDEPTARRRC